MQGHDARQPARRNEDAEEDEEAADAHPLEACLAGEEPTVPQEVTRRAQTLKIWASNAELAPYAAISSPTKTKVD